jgi:hypothetical protein
MRGEKLMWKWKDLTPFGQRIIIGVVLCVVVLLMLG